MIGLSSILSSRKFHLLAILFLFTAANVPAQSMFRKVLDFDGDGKADLAIARDQNGSLVWYVQQSSGGARIFQWGLPLDVPAAGDYDGDGKADIAVFRENQSQDQVTYSFYILQSQTNSFVSATFNGEPFSSSTPVQQDYDGDGKTDPAVSYGQAGNTSVFAYNLSPTSSGGIVLPIAYNFAKIGNIDSIPGAEAAYVKDNTLKYTNIQPGGFNEVHTSDITALNNSSFLSQMVAADFDGDGKGELAVYRYDEGSWYWVRSSDGVLASARFGANGDYPVPADYDGDGKTDLAIWRPGTLASPQSYYWINASQNGLSVIPWGVADDKVVQY